MAVTYYVVFEDLDEQYYKIRFITPNESAAKQWYESHEMDRKALVRYDFEGITQKSNTCLMCNYIKDVVNEIWDEVL